ncbi:MAG: glycerol kinase GlpK [Bdellovibrionales bacterium]|nr:glycerol kinase GlpK [Bdellovibrionales bacterium]
MTPLILSIDQGTTGTKVLVMDGELNKVAEQYTAFEQHFPRPGWVEHDLEQIWGSVCAGLDSVLTRVDPKRIVAIGITNQRETICFWNKKTLAPIRRAIVWQDRRTADRCEGLKKSGLESMVQEKTGLLLDPYFSGSKLEWALNHDQAVASSAKRGELAVGTIDSFLLSRLTRGKIHATDSSNASRTLFMDLKTLQWDPGLMSVFGVESSMLPEIRPTFGEFGKTSGVRGLPDGIPITGMIGDQQSALLGQAAVEEGMAKCTYGTGAFLLMNTGASPRTSKSRLLTTVAWSGVGASPTYALEGSAFMAGAVVQWLRDGLGMIRDSGEIEALAGSVPSSEGVIFVPAFTGLGAPFWNPNARAMISGLTRGSTRGHIARAALEGIAFQNVDILSAMEKDLGAEIKGLCVDGGACRNDLLMQIQSDLLGRNLFRPAFTETTALGAVFAGGLGSGIWSSVSDVKKAWKLEREFSPRMTPGERDLLMKNWSLSVARVSLSS